LFLLRIEFSGPQLLQIIVARQGLELLLQDSHRFHRRKDAGHPAVNVQGCRLVAGGLADHHLLHELAHDVDERLLRFRVGLLAHVIEGRVDDQLDGLRADFGLQLPDLFAEIFLRRRVLQPRLEPGPVLLKLVEHIVKGDKSRVALGLAIADLLDDLALFLFGSLQFVGKTLSRIRFVPAGCRNVLANLPCDIV